MKRSVLAGAHLMMFAWALGAAGCRLIPTELEPLQGGLRFALSETHEGLSGRDPVIRLLVQTDREYHSISNQVRGRVSVTGGEIRVQIAGIAPCSGCADAIGPASLSEILPLTEGVYPLIITYGGSTDRYTVSITAEAIEVSPVSASFTAPRFETFWRFPRDSFAFHCDAGSHAAACDTFREILFEKIPLTPLSFAEGGVVPYPRAENWIAEYYRYDRAADFENAGQLLLAFALENPGVTMRLVSWRNQHYTSWSGVH
jgi:hypothetical protein